MNCNLKLRGRVGLVLLLLTFAVPVQLSAELFSYQTLDASHGAAGPNTTRAYGINNSGEVVGFYAGGGPGDQNGFLYSGGVYTTVTGPVGNQSQAFGINDSGQIVGVYPNGQGGPNSYILSGGNYNIIIGPGAIPGAGTAAFDINNSGMVAGYFSTNQNIGYNNAFVENNGVYDVFPAASLPVANSGEIFFRGINDAGQVAGHFYELLPGGGLLEHGFVQDGGVFTLLDVPGATRTEAWDINNSGQVTGWYQDATGSGHGFLLSNGLYTTLDVPGGSNTQAHGINNLGQIVGTYSTPMGDYGFIATPGISLVPEPSSFALCGLGLMLLTCANYRNRRRNAR